MTVGQRRGRRIMMTPGEVDAFLTTQRTCRVATVSAGGAPHVSALWFLWDGTALWLYSVVRSKRWADLRRDPRVAIVVDTGEEYGQLRGVELSGTVEFVGEVPRTGELCAELDAVETLFARKNFGLDTIPHDGRHAWVRLRPEKVVSWDFRKLGDA
ncbi:pyridoxamine 5'-phosphate oxidase family protein [Streptomyces longwoodensis]|jgi:PPOX class probable F420-dependent enzyme|uniref:Pyridoxamine 5'-phosphate oxidase family protein n=1 Tax=Streptomyces lasalocidi TaxID=324833 RepID=A0A4U5WGT1_STRLS|nr:MULTISPECIES: pyridoxamine 5'-phosphate oxidase family protein [Streptomyces]MCX4999541.1 pyridoxamine 5'-phosphate oxidase family protein [Streptomyces longwoodensis]TKS99655.1 pyridoxamine 5'-phosphate oxidase family protein [Streptomyces lasalocidi]WRY87321.1 pyridoxamine 5'-phosphate oxidase family protein [Streptomyces longwoodensis]WTI48281.1 pyridoxamine 5'-phosphate oxidase family protein [Streptomyces longwoodensis]WUC74553.1 pyridoxamine 5'-phosphate oxidase family protein [Strept